LPLLVTVAVPIPRLDPLTYLAADGMAVEPGMRVVVPVGPRRMTGCVLETVRGDRASLTPAAKKGLKPIARVLDTEPLVPRDVLDLALWAADYYLCGAGETLAAALPPMARSRADAFKRRLVARLTDAGRQADPTMLTPRQRAALNLLASEPDGVAIASLARGDLSPPVFARLADRGLVTLQREQVDRDPFDLGAGTHSGAAADSPLAVSPTQEQQRAIEELTGLATGGTFAVALLHGVTASGKTHVYLRLADAVRRAGRRVLLLVPEISLTPALAALVRQAFGDAVAVQHSGLSEGERHDQWHRIRRGDVHVVVGTRSAVFAPLSSIGLIVVDEEHDASYKQDESPRYHGRDLAIVRGQRSGALVVLGSATPSLESYQHAVTGRYRLVSLERRTMDRPLASVELVDMREAFAAEGPEVVLSPALRVAVAQRLEAGEQSLLLLNRRGYAVAMFCRQCAGALECPDCSVTLTVYRSARQARCHYCDYAMRVPERCPACGGEFLEYRGVGTERIEAEVRGRFPAARVARVDRDTVRRRGTIARVLREFARREIDILIGTQMIAKGHDFPEVTFVGVISADVGLGIADFRAAERTFQLLTQVVGRAGRGTRQGHAIVQTLYPRHYSIVHAARQDYRGFFKAELVYRTAMRYPPVLSLVNLVVRGASAASALGDAARLARQLRASGSTYQVLGPAPAPLSRLRGEYRAQVFLKGRQRAAMRRAIVRALARHPDVARRTTVDVDPVSML
jgi:primosomal protein N' (replication factor Y) (superfamily II helicase)